MLDVGAENGENGAEGMKPLRDHDTLFDSWWNARRHVRLGKPEIGRAVPTQVERDSEQKNVHPVSQKGRTVSGGIRKQLGRKGREGDREQEQNVNPGTAAMGPGQIIKLGLLAHPKDAERQKAHHIYEKSQGKKTQRAPEFPLGVCCRSRRHAEAEDKRRHCHCEDAAAQGR